MADVDSTLDLYGGYEELQNCVQKLEQTVAGLAADKESFLQKIELMEGLHAHSVQKLQEQKHSLKSRVQKLEQSVAGLTAENELLGSKYKEEMRKRADLEEQVARFDEEKGALEALRAENDELQRTILELVPEDFATAGELENRVQELEQTASRLTAEKELLDSKYKEEMRKRSDLEDQVARFDQQKGALEALKVKNEELQQTLLEQVPEHHAASEELESRVQELEQTVADLAAGKESLAQKIEVMEGSHARCIQDLEEQKHGLEDMLSKATEKKDDLEDVLVRKGAYCILLETEMAARRNVQYNVRSTILRDDLKFMRDRCATLEKMNELRGRKEQESKKTTQDAPGDNSDNMFKTPPQNRQRSILRRDELRRQRPRGMFGLAWGNFAVRAGSKD